MSLNGISAAALSALHTNSTALRVVSNNVANLNTEGYARRSVALQANTVGGQLAGVSIGEIQRIADRFLTGEALSAGSASSRYTTEGGVFQQLSAILGNPGDSGSLTARLNGLTAALGQSSLSPTASASQLGALNSFQNLASSISTLATSVSGLRDQVDQQVVASIGGINATIKQIYDLNSQIKTAQINGDQATGLLDQRDVALTSLADSIGIRTVDQPDGRLGVLTEDGINLVGDTYTQLAYTPGANNGAYGSITSQDLSPASGTPVGQPQAFDPHLTGGKLKGLVEMRDNTLADLGQELGNLARSTALAYNQVHNANTAFPPPASFTGRNTGLVATDALNFTGKTTIAVADPNGAMVSRIDIDFGTNTISVNGGPAAGFTATVGGLQGAINGALGSNGSASFANGLLALSATGGNGIVTQDDATTPSNRGGYGFSQFFGLNDVFRSAAPSILSTGLSAADASNFAAGSTISLQLKGPNGEMGRSGTITLSAGMSIGNVVTALNTAMGGAVSFTLNADGSISQTQSGANASYKLNVTADTTQRGTTGMSFTQIFGIGANQPALTAQSFAVNPQVAAAPARLAFAKSQITSSTTPGSTIVGHGDNSGAIALQNIGSTQQSFAQAGSMAAQVASLTDYAGSFYQDVATRGTQVDTNQTAQTDRLQEAKTRLASTSGVNLDEELTHMMSYQQAYAAGARMLSVVGQL
ncbi:MAG: flagellar hook-associated protein FlgK, partial [Alphaproteobacteria bacterium]|nr:flagellar hook-associated protein FlgK [Alphaproteobacteria bacterium]